VEFRDLLANLVAIFGVGIKIKIPLVSLYRLLLLSFFFVVLLFAFVRAAL